MNDILKRRLQAAIFEITRIPECRGILVDADLPEKALVRITELEKALNNAESALQAALQGKVKDDERPNNRMPALCQTRKNG
jgi:hypothetical protein